MTERVRATQVLSAIAVTLSLIFVGLEIRQNTSAMRGATMQSISDANSELLAQISTDEALASHLAKVFEGATRVDFQPGEYIQLAAFSQAFVRQLENIYLQNREGIVSEEVFDTYMWSDPFVRTPFFAEWWENISGDVVSVEFRSFLEAQVDFEASG